MKNAQSTVVPIRQSDGQVAMNVKSVDKKNVIPATAKLLKVYLQKAVALHLEQIQQQMFDSADVEGMDSLTADIQILQKASKYLSSLYIDSVVKNLSSFSTEPRRANR